jgi:hypothetical protein
MKEYYDQKIKKNSAEIELLGKKGTQNAFARLFVFIFTLAFAIWLFRTSAFVSIMAAIAGFVWFGMLIKRGIDIQKKLEFAKRHLLLNQQELGFCDLQFPETYDGSEFVNYNHNYTSDLAIFGKWSLFHYLNRSYLQLSREKLADWLKIPATSAQISARHGAVKELLPLDALRQRITVDGSFAETGKKGISEFLAWLDEPQSIPSIKSIRWFAVSLSLLSVIVIVLASTILPANIIALPVLIAIPVLYRHLKKINALHSRLNGYVALLTSYSKVIESIEKQTFESKYCKEIQNHFINNSLKASQTIKNLCRILDLFDMKFNWLFHVPLNLYFLYDFHVVYSLENWKVANAPKIKTWFDAISEFECLSALANASFNNPGWAFPQIEEGKFIFSATNLGHPLIKADKRVNNDFSMDENSASTILTGSNMSGKSTFLRTIGINIILAMTGAPVCASRMQVSIVSVYTSMIIKDSLEENISTFYAELLRIKRIIELSAEAGNHLFLVDEPLRGTNSDDRLTGNKALIRQLARNHSPFIIATHDLALSAGHQETSGKLTNFHFDVQIKGKELFFDYRIHPGICQSRNASILMEKIGILLD